MSLHLDHEEVTECQLKLMLTIVTLPWDRKTWHCWHCTPPPAAIYIHNMCTCTVWPPSWSRSLFLRTSSPQGIMFARRQERNLVQDLRKNVFSSSWPVKTERRVFVFASPDLIQCEMNCFCERERSDGLRLGWLSIDVQRDVCIY